MLFIEKSTRFSDYIKFDMSSQSADIPKLSMLRVEMERVHPGMSDFVMRVSTPKYAGVAKSGTILSIRGTRAFTKYDTIEKLAKTICEGMDDKGDETHSWDECDLSHLADMLYPQTKFFAGNARVEQMKYTTEALV